MGQEVERDLAYDKEENGYGAEESEVDYRKTRAWEKVVSRCTGRRGYDVHTSPHWLFSGVGEGIYMMANGGRQSSGYQGLGSSLNQGFPRAWTKLVL